MDRTLAFRRGLLTRLLRVSAFSLPFAALAGSACEAPVGSGGAGGAGSTSGTGGTAVVPRCFAWPEASTGTGDAGTGGAGTGGAATGTGGAGTGGAATGTGGATSDAGVPKCPSMVDAYGKIPMQSPCSQILSEGTFAGGQCCYQVAQTPCLGTGRPFLDEGRARTASPRRAPASGGAWAAEGVTAPQLAGLPLAARARLAAAWTTDGLLEHASVASFGRFAFELLAVGAPAELIAAAHRAAVDEVEHARLCLSLAGAYAGEAIAPAPFPFQGRVEVSADLAAIAARAVREGCVGETLASIQAAEQLALAQDPAVRAALARITEDEARHAELAWRFVAWALAQGDARVFAAVAQAFAEPAALPDGGPDALFAEVMEAHGRLDAASLRATLTRALDDVVRPCAASLLADAPQRAS
jgi:hypothetical protein